MIRIERVSWTEAEEALSLIRRAVFIEEQRVPEVLEWDGEDKTAVQLMALDDDVPVGTLRMLVNGHLGRMAVLKPFRNRGIGHMLMQRMMEIARDNGLSKLTLSAQTHAVPFYLQFGFIADNEVFMDAGIPHRHMHKLLTQK
ncbi:MAG: GNAT family N-acetyltransferase [Gammaproteobacteria bacterium]|nr:GNAT family N-acetyltransferase [Gammaproteobacteria bacterium]